MTKRILLIACLLLILTGCSKTTESSYEEITLAECIEKFEKNETFAFIIFYDGCPYCAEAEPLFEKAAKESGSKAYYINFTHVWAREQTEDVRKYDLNYDKLCHFLDSQLVEEEDGTKSLWVPQAAFIKNGIVVMGHTGTLDDHDPYEAKMTKEQQEKVLKIYLDGFDSIKSGF